MDLYPTGENCQQIISNILRFSISCCGHSGLAASSSGLASVTIGHWLQKWATKCLLTCDKVSVLPWLQPFLQMPRVRCTGAVTRRPSCFKVDITSSNLRNITQRLRIFLWNEDLYLLKMGLHDENCGWTKLDGSSSLLPYLCELMCFNDHLIPWSGVIHVYPCTNCWWQYASHILSLSIQTWKRNITKDKHNIPMHVWCTLVINKTKG